MLTQRAIEQGRLTLTTPVQQFLPQGLLQNPYEAQAPVQIVHLLEHTAGIDDMSLHAIYRDQEVLDTPLNALRHDAVALSVRWQPGTKMAYSNVGYSVLAAVLEQVYQRDFDSLMREQVLTPLALHDTVMSNAEATHGEYAQGYTGGDSTGNGVTDVGLPPIWHRAAGTIWSTAHDLALLGRFLLSEGRSQPGVLRAETVRDMRRVHSTEAARAGLEWGYGLGLFQQQLHGLHQFGHNGAIDGFSANLFFDPERGVGYAEIHNSDNTLVKFARPLSGYVQSLPVQTPVPVPAVQPVPAALAQALKGWYRYSNPRHEIMRGADWLTGAWHAEIVDNELVLQPLQGEPVRLQYLGGDRWRDMENGQIDTIMLRDAGGNIVAIDTDGTHFVRSSLFAVFAPLAALILSLLTLVTAPFGRRRALQNPWLRRLNLSALLSLGLVIAGLATIEGMKTVAMVNLSSILVFAGTLLLPVLSVVALMAWLSQWRHEVAKVAKWRSLLGTLGAATFSIYFACFNWLGLALWLR